MVDILRSNPTFLLWNSVAQFDKGLLVRSSSHCVVSFQKQDILSAAALELVQPMKTGNHSNMTEKKNKKIVDCDIIKASK